MMDLLQAILFATAPLVALTNPIAEVPVFLAIIEGRDRSEANRAALKVAGGVWVVLIGSATLGLTGLSLLGIELPSFHAAGGLLLVVMGLEMLQGREPGVQSLHPRSEDGEDALWVPLVMPMLAGPGAMVVTVSLTLHDDRLFRLIPVATTAAITLAALVVYGTLRLAAVAAIYMPARTARIMTRFSGLILVAIGVQMGFTGVREFFGT